MKEIFDHKELSDKEFENQFSSANLNPDLFSHEAHLRLAWIHIMKYGLSQAEKNIAVQIKSYVTNIGAQDKYNITVTIASVKMLYHFIKHSQTDNFYDFIKENPRLQTEFKELLMSHYSTNIFESKEAKTKFIEPELLPFHEF